MRRSGVIVALLVLGVAAAVVLGSAGASSAESQAAATLSCKLSGIRYVGTTSQKKQLCFTLTANGRQIREYAYDFRGPCSDGGVATGNSRTASPKGIPVSGSGSFSTGTTSYFKGQIRGTSASGTLRFLQNQFSAVTYGQSTCDSGAVRWTARKAAS